MQVISTNLGQKTTIIHNGKNIETGIFKYSVQQTIKLGYNDVFGDTVVDRRYHGGVDKACYLYSTDYYELWKQIYPDLNWQWGMFGENLSVEGLNEEELFIGDIYKLGTAFVQITQPRQPCFKFGLRMNDANAVKTFISQEKPGAYVRVIESGEVNIGDNFSLVDKSENSISIREIFHLIYHASENISRVKQAINIPELADSCRNDLIKYAKI